MKNWPSLAWWLIDMCIVNAFHYLLRRHAVQPHSSISASSSCTS